MSNFIFFYFRAVAVNVGKKAVSPVAVAVAYNVMMVSKP